MVRNVGYRQFDVIRFARDYRVGCSHYDRLPVILGCESPGDIINVVGGILGRTFISIIVACNIAVYVVNSHRNICSRYERDIG